MTYVLVTNAGEVDARPGAPTVDELIELTGGGVPELVHSRHGDKLAAWVDDNWIAKVESGEFSRNSVASVVQMVTGGELTPYGGPIVWTGLTEQDGQILPTALPDEVAEAVTVVATDVSAVLAGHPEAASFYAKEDDEKDTSASGKAVDHDDDPEVLVAQIRHAAREAADLPLTGLDGGWSLAKTAQRVAQNLRDNGMPEFLIEMILTSQELPYTRPEPPQAGDEESYQGA